MDQRKYISYLRVSTAAQGRSGLGMEAQRASVAGFLHRGRCELLYEYVEVESGKKNDRERPQLSRALHHCKITGATLLIAKLDRLARDAHFLLGLQKAGVKFQAADMPEANEMVVGIMAVIAEGERKMISERTKAALAVAKARGVKLGNPNGAAHLRGLGNARAVEAIKANAKQRALDVVSTIEDIIAGGVTSANRIATALNNRGILTPRKARWYAASVKRVMERECNTKTLVGLI